MDVIAVYQQVGAYRGAAEICGTTRKTVSRVVKSMEAGEVAQPAPVASARNHDLVIDVVAKQKALCAGIMIVVGGRRCRRRVSTWSSIGPRWAAGCTCSARCWRGRGGIRRVRHR
jgi:hypothetical protein